jgi:hypothetical protein
MARSKSKTTTVAEEELTGAAVGGEMDVRARVLAAVQAIDRGFIVLGRGLSEIYHQELYRPWGFRSFEHYCEEELDYSYRKAKYLIEITDKIKDMNLSDERVEAIGWGKMSKIVSVVTDKNVENWMTIAENSTSKALELEVKRVVDRGGAEGQEGADSRPAIFRFRLGADDASIVSEALAESKRLAETESDGMALTQICEDWFQTMGANPERTTLDHHIAYLEQAYGVKLAVTLGAAKKTSTPVPEEVHEEVPDAAPTEEADVTPVDTDEELLGDNDIDAIMGVSRD